jgi:Fe-Mn family superoxide dismutase
LGPLAEKCILYNNQSQQQRGNNMPENYYKIDLMPLTYDYKAMEPYISTQTMQVHHDRLLNAYVDKLNAILALYPNLQKFSLEHMLEKPYIIPEKARISVINFGGAVFNHNFFFNSLKPGTAENVPVGNLGKAIDLTFGSLENFKKVFLEKAMSVFGSGWMWLVKDHNNNLILEQTANQHTPITLGHVPLVVIDVWEHAYFLQYLNLRNEYINNWFNIINWGRADELYNQ